MVPSSAMTSRRGFLRRFGGVATLGALTGGAGCLSIANPIRQSMGGYDGGTSADTALSESEFTTYTETMAARYGDAGVWGLGSAPRSPAFVGAWTHHHRTGDADDGESYLAVVDYAVVCYFVGQRGETNEHHYRYWLWGAAQPVDETTIELPTGPVAATAKLRGLGLSVAFGDPEQLHMYAPGGDHKQAGVIDIRFGAPDGDPVAGTFRLHEGEVAPSPPRTWDRDGSFGQDTDDYIVGWQGAYAGIQSVNAVCWTARPADAPTDVIPFDWQTHVAAGGYL